MNNQDPLFDLFPKNRLLAAVTVKDAALGVKIARALCEGGLQVMEITFRTSATADAIEAIRNQVPDMTVGAGTILTPEQVDHAIEAGAVYGLAPGFNPRVAEHAVKKGLPFIPGVTTPSEIELALEMGFRLLKLFPANNLGGPGYIRSLQGPYGHTGVQFIPMGGVYISNLAEYSGLDHVVALGGSWLVPSDVQETGDTSDIPDMVRRSLSELSVNPSNPVSD
jgi:2-dehydro-3-deoxyphosphogluconate aldolase / (4S)-4-hydroxy-2-oxoglutarate aldolase